MFFGGRKTNTVERVWSCYATAADAQGFSQDQANACEGGKRGGGNSQHLRQKLVFCILAATLSVLRPDKLRSAGFFSSLKELCLSLCFSCSHRSLAKDGIMPDRVKSFLIWRTAEVRSKRSRSRVRRERARRSHQRGRAQGWYGWCHGTFPL